MSNAPLVLGVAGVALVGVGLAVAYQKAEAEKKVSTLAPGAPKAVAPNIPTHTTAPTAEQQNATLLQLLSAYRSDLARLQSERLSAEMEMQQAEAAGARACDAYAFEPEFTYRCHWATCMVNWWEMTSRRVDPVIQGRCKAAVTGGGIINSRTVEMRGEHNQEAWQILMNEIEQARNQAQAAAQRYQKAKLQIEQIDRQIAEVQKKIADLNARGVY